VIDVGGGDSRLVDHLVAHGLHCLTVLDVSAAALGRARARLGPQANLVKWIEADVTDAWTAPPVDVWHDGAVFHFLTEPEDRAPYVANLRAAVRAGGTVIMATFALGGPERCSGLPVRRYDAEGMRLELGAGFARVETVAHAHRTPSGVTQAFIYCRFIRQA
jgi:hypothetical protein